MHIICLYAACVFIYHEIFLASKNKFLSLRIQSHLWKLHSLFHDDLWMILCTGKHAQSEEPGVWEARRLSEQNRTRGLGQLAAFPYWRNKVSDLLLPSAQWAAAGKGAWPGNQETQESNSVLLCCGSRSVILLAHPLSNLRLGGLNSVDTFKRKTMLCVWG